MLPKKDPRHATTQRYPASHEFTVLTPGFAEGKGSPTDGPSDAVESLNPSGVNNGPHPHRKGVTPPQEAAMHFTVLDAVGDTPLVKLATYPDPKSADQKPLSQFERIEVYGTGSGRFLARMKYRHSTTERMYACKAGLSLIPVFHRRLNSGEFASVCWAFLGKVF